MRLLQQVLTIHHEGRPDLFKGGTTKYTEAQLQQIIADDARPIFVMD
ncbi:MAG TPA: GNAT family N-acetyltransferase, partial [Treponema sp.]|nr:GNAT family N-acetyltransferase [Treponema sp.]